jgi:hypothetical protein
MLAPGYRFVAIIETVLGASLPERVAALTSVRFAKAGWEKASTLAAFTPVVPGLIQVFSRRAIKP